MALTFAQLAARMEADYLRINGLEQVTVRRHTEAGVVQTTVVVPHGHQQGATESVEVNGEWIAASELLVWRLLVSELGGLDLRRGDTIEPGGGPVWTVWMAPLVAYRTRFNATCIRG